MQDWITVPEIAAHCRTTTTRVDDVLSLLGLTDSRAHATHDDGPRRYSPRVVDLVRRELRSQANTRWLQEQEAAVRARGETCVTVRSSVQTWNPLTDKPITLELVATGPMRSQDGVSFVDCTLGGISEYVVEEPDPSPRLHVIESETDA